MASEDLFTFMYEGKKVEVFTGSSSSDVFYQKAGGNKYSAGLRYNSEKGWFQNGAGRIVTFDEAKSHIRNLL